MGMPLLKIPIFPKKLFLIISLGWTYCLWNPKNNSLFLTGTIDPSLKLYMLVIVKMCFSVELLSMCLALLAGASEDLNLDCSHEQNSAYDKIPFWFRDSLWKEGWSLPLGHSWKHQTFFVVCFLFVSFFFAMLHGPTLLNLNFWIEFAELLLQ